MTDYLEPQKMTKFVRLLVAFWFGALLLPSAGAADAREYVLGAGDIIRITVFQNSIRASLESSVLLNTRRNRELGKW